MGSQNNAGAAGPFGKLLRDANLRRSEFEDSVESNLERLQNGNRVEAIVAAARLAELFEALAQGRVPSKNQILCGW